MTTTRSLLKLSVNSPVEVGVGLTKQEVTVSDASGAIKSTFWEDCVKVGVSYKFIICLDL